MGIGEKGLCCAVCRHEHCRYVFGLLPCASAVGASYSCHEVVAFLVSLIEDYTSCNAHYQYFVALSVCHNCRIAKAAVEDIIFSALSVCHKHLLAPRYAVFGTSEFYVHLAKAYVASAWSVVRKGKQCFVFALSQSRYAIGLVVLCIGRKKKTLLDDSGIAKRKICNITAF